MSLRSCRGLLPTSGGTVAVTAALFQTMAAQPDGDVVPTQGLLFKRDPQSTYIYVYVWVML